MEFPSWSNFLSKLSSFELNIYSEKSKAAKKIRELKDNHPVFDEIINNALPFLPPPFNGIAQAIYNSFDGSKEEKVDAVLKFLVDFKEQGESHYNKVAFQLDNIAKEIVDMKSNAAKENTLLSLRDVLISKDEITTKKLDEIIEIIKGGSYTIMNKSIQYYTQSTQQGNIINLVFNADNIEILKFAIPNYS